MIDTNIKVQTIFEPVGAVCEYHVDSFPNDRFKVYFWLVPDTVSSTCKVRVSDAADGYPSDVSDGTFVIEPSITVTSPNGGEVLGALSYHNITWTSAGSVGNVKIEYSHNGGLSWETIEDSTANDGVFNWRVPFITDFSSEPTFPGNEFPQEPIDTIDPLPKNYDLCLIRISEASDGSPIDVSDHPFTIVEEPIYLNLTSPNGGQEWLEGSTYNITWTSAQYTGNLKIEYTIDNGNNWLTVTNSAGTPNDGSHPWTVPDIPGTDSSNCKIRISGVSGGFTTDTSNSTFTIIRPQTLRVTSPNGGESVWTSSSYTIKWVGSPDISNVKIQYSLNGGLGWTTVKNADSTPNDGYFNWTVPDSNQLPQPYPPLSNNLISSECLIKISDAGGGSAYGVSLNQFSIYAKDDNGISFPQQEL